MTHPVETRERNREYREKNRERRRVSHRAWRAKNIEKVKRVAQKHHYKKYGLTVAEYEALVVSQNGLCALCRTKPKHKLYVDHDHETNKRRALLCQRCNIFIGHLETTPVPVLKALAYIKRGKI